MYMQDHAALRPRDRYRLVWDRSSRLH